MDFENETPFASAAVRAQLVYRDLLQAIVVVKATYDVSPGGAVTLAADQPAVITEDTETEHGPVETEITLPKPGCDVAVFGHACAPEGTLVGSLGVGVSIGAFRREVAVVGDRHWERGVGGLRPSAPVPFATMPLTYDRAFGGRARMEGHLEGPWFANPEGRGFVVHKEDAAGSPLPNIEEPRSRMTCWDDRPDVAGVAPLPRASSLRGMRGLEVDMDAQTTFLTPAAFSFAHPKMTLPRYPAGAEVVLTGVRPDGPWAFALPALAPALRVSLGRASYTLPVVPDTLYFHPGAGRVSVVGRCAFVYQLAPKRARAMRIIAAGVDTDVDGSATTIARERAAQSPRVPLVVDVSPDLAFVPIDDLVAMQPLRHIVDHLPLCPS